MSEAESDGEAFCSQRGCKNTFPDGLIMGAVVEKAVDGKWIQVSVIIFLVQFCRRLHKCTINISAIGCYQVSLILFRSYSSLLCVEY
jgi:hypothetical protein